MRKLTKAEIQFVTMINNQLRSVSEKSYADKAEFTGFLTGLCSAVETLLHCRNLYKGFAYLTPEEMDYPNQTPGMVKEGDEYVVKNELRRKYFI
jgi:hypothetical protein